MKIVFFNLLIFFIFLSVNAEARLKLTLFRPVEEFVTNNRELVIEGMVECPGVQRVAISVNTPAGVSDLGALEESLQSLIIDLGDSYPLKLLLISPVLEDGLSFGPRVVKLSSSEDGKMFVEKGIFNCSSGMGQEHGESRVELGSDIKARYIQIDMIDGWQAGRIRIQNASFLDTEGKLLETKIKDLSVMLKPEEDKNFYFLVNILLRNGENSISIVASAVDSAEEIEQDFMLVEVTYMPEVSLGKELLILSDGYKAELSIMPGALTPEIRKIGIHPLDVKKINWMSYADNLRIEKNTRPVLAYEIQVSAATPFPVTAKDSLERQPPNLAVDGNPEYPSTWMSTVSPLPVWLRIDIREPRPISKVAVTARVEEKISYGPKRLSVLISDDDINYLETARCDECSDNITEIILPGAPTARYVKLVIEDGKQGNNIQINEVELFDDEGVTITSYARLKAAYLARPAELIMLYDDSDLRIAGIQREENLAIFNWNEGMQNWEMIGGKVDPANNRLSVNLNYLSTFAVFEAVPPLDGVRWSYNPFSPNGDGIADITTITISLKEEDEQARIEIFDYTGKLIRTLVYEEKSSGYISIVWDGKDEDGHQVSIGPYIYQVIVGKEVWNGVLIVAR